MTCVLFDRYGEMTASWIIKRKSDGKVIAETFSQKTVDKLTDQYEAIPVMDYLKSLNQNKESGENGKEKRI